METNAEILLENVRRGFACAYDGLQIDPLLQDKGYEIACEIWPDYLVDKLV